MDSPVTIDAARRELLLADLRYWGESFWKNEEAGESRIKFYIALVTAVGGGLSALYQFAFKEGYDLAAFGQLVPVAVAGVLLIGLVTFARMVRRDQVTDEYKELGDEIRRYLLEDPLFERVYGRGREAPQPRKLLNGGMTSMMFVMNGVVAGILAGFVALSEGQATGLAVGLLGVLVTSWAQYAFLGGRHRKAKEKYGAREQVRLRHRT